MVPLAWADLIFLVNQAFFVITAVIVTRRLLLDRRRADLDIALLFSTMAVLLVLPRIAMWLGAPSEVRAVMVTPLILAVPYLMLRLVADFAVVPWWALRIAEAAFASQVIAFLFQGSLPFVAIAAYAAVPFAWSSVAFVRQALRTRGGTSRRYAAIATGNAAAVSSLIVVAVAAGLRVEGDAAAVAGILLQLCVLATGTAYFVGFATPRWLRRLWRDAELRSFLAMVPRVMVGPGGDELSRALAAGAREALGFDGALIGSPVGSDRLRFVGTGETYEAPYKQTFGGRTLRAGRALVSLDPVRDVPEQAALYQARNAKMLVAAPIRIGGDVLGVLATRSTTPSLFTGDELEMCQLLADQIAIVLKGRALLEERERLAETDALTGLPHAHVLYQRLEGHFASAGGPIAFVLMDVDAFAEVNQTFGHPTGDEVLSQITRRLSALLPEGAGLARWGGDQYAVVIPGGTVVDAEAVAARVLACLERPIVVGPDEVECGASIGIAVHPDHAADARGLIAAADVALAVAKRTANTYAVYPLETHPLRAQRAALRSDLRRAIADGSIRLEYQPLVSMRSGGLLRLEALARWEDPRRGTIPPSEFVEVAERTGLIRPLTDRILRQALRDADEWRRWLPRLRVAVNLSARTFAEAGLVDQVAAACSETSCDPGGLSLEITESILMTEPERARETIARLRALGVTTEIDDFGTGYSSLAYLQRLPVSGLKIDRQFIVAMAADERSDAIVRATIRLSHELGFEVTAEGIGEERLWELLAASGCDVGQGFYIGRPMPAEAVGGWLSSWLVRVPGPPSAGSAAVPMRRVGGLVFVVDDDPAILSVVRDVLSEHGYAVETAADGDEALALMARRKPDAILLDVHMPRVDGEAFAARMRGRGVDVPLVVTTAGPSAGEWAERLRARASVAKPFSVDDLLSAMRRAMEDGTSGPIAA